MQEAEINKELALAYPDEFRVMELSELHHAFGVDYPKMWGIRNEERHVLISVIWKDTSEVLQRLVSTKSQVKEYEKRIHNLLRKNNYHCEGFFERELAGQKALGFRYSFLREFVEQIGEVIIFKRGKCRYSMYYFTRLETADDNRPAYEELLSSMQVL